jgi:outer membrane protein assembly factor BamB
MRPFVVVPLLIAVLAAIGSVADTSAAPAAATPVVTSLSATTLPRSGRLLISGAGFGTTQGASQVSIGGLTAPVTRWSDTLVVAYVPEATNLGTVDVQVLVDGAPTAAVPLTVTTRQANGPVRWRFQVDAQIGYLDQRPAVGADGTIVAHDPMGNVYALTPDGGLKWIFKTAIGPAGPPSIDNSGNVYVASMNTIYALAPDGRLKWTFTEPSGGQGVIVGPTVGPDGNIYALTEEFGLGALALSPAGQLLWSNPGDPLPYEMGQVGAEVVFDATGHMYVAVNDSAPTGGVLYAFTLGGLQQWAQPVGGSYDGMMQAQPQPATGPDGTLYMTGSGTYRDLCSSCLWALDPATGATKWTYAPFAPGGLSEPTIGSDGTIYLGRSLRYLDAVTPNGTTRWSTLDCGILAHPTIDPQNTQLVAGDTPDYGQPGSVRDFSAADGRVQWDISLPSENGGDQVLSSRPRFAADGQTVYFGTAITAPFLAPKSPDQYAYLYAVDTSGTAPAPQPASLASLTLTPAQVKGGTSSLGSVALTRVAPAGGATVALWSDSPVASVPASVTVPACASTASFTVTTKTVKRTKSATISAAYSGLRQSATLTITN